MTIETLGIDIAKNVFQLHGVNSDGRVLLKSRVVRDQLVAVVAQIERCTIAIEPALAPSAGHGSSKHSGTR